MGLGGMATIGTAHSAKSGFDDKSLEVSEIKPRACANAGGGRLEVVHVGQTYLKRAVFDAADVNVAKPVGVAHVEANFTFV